ncbi:MAG: hypothetical protein P1U87_19685 [Verrucomicrobiales bacterium]|nr:hypothetical protein [Verrucomicrobiales bacterium]
MLIEVDQQELRNHVKHRVTYLSSQLHNIQASVGSTSETASAERSTSSILDLIEDQERTTEILSERVGAFEEQVK